MQSLILGRRQLNANPVRYYLLAEQREDRGKNYGVQIENGGETATIGDITPSQGGILSLITAMMNGFVTPVTTRDVVEDWLAR